MAHGASRPCRVLVTGTGGQVVGALREMTASRDDLDLIRIGRPDLDLSETRRIAPAIEEMAPDLILSVAAFTGVDAAEADEALALTVNATAVGEIGKAAARLGVPVVHLSTDYVFDGKTTVPYVETDTPAPLNVYGRTKLAGETALAAATSNHAILRTAWVYSPFGRNFVKTMLTLAQSGETISVVADQIGNPTSALDLAGALLSVGEALLASGDPNLRGVFHVAGGGDASWADLSEAVFRIASGLGGPTARVERVPTSAYPTPARRPAQSRLDCRKLERVHKIRLPDWHLSVETVVRRLVGDRAAAPEVAPRGERGA